MDGWDEIVKASLLGTERRPFASPSLPSALTPIAQALSSRPAEAALLGTAATIHLYRQAGQSFRAQERATTQSEPETTPAVHAAAADYLAQMLAGTHLDVLPEWLRACAAAGRRVPHRLLPDLIEAARTSAPLRELILPVIGARGRWLMSENHDWQFAATDDEESTESIWQTGSRDLRLSLLRRLRAKEPGRARALVESTWA